MRITLSTLANGLYCASVALSAPTSTKRQSGGSSYDGGATANDVQNGVCAPITLIFARGSTETGNMGSSVGPALAQSLLQQLGASGVAIQGVDYSATIESNLSGGSDGGPEMAKLAQQALQNCPNTKIALSGYSQGGTVTHYAVGQGGLDASQVSSAVLYGDPQQSQPVGDLPAERVKEFCASGDGVCETGGFAITAAHLSYTSGSYIPDGVAFIIQNAGGSGGGSATSNATDGASSTSGSGTASPSASGSLIPGLGSGSSSIPGLSGSSGASSIPELGSSSDGSPITTLVGSSPSISGLGSSSDGSSVPALGGSAGTGASSIPGFSGSSSGGTSSVPELSGSSAVLGGGSTPSLGDSSSSGLNGIGKA